MIGGRRKAKSTFEKRMRYRAMLRENGIGEDLLQAMLACTPSRTMAAPLSFRDYTLLEEGDVILMHDGYQSSVDAALQIVDLLTAQGYEFVTVDELVLP